MVQTALRAYAPQVLLILFTAAEPHVVGDMSHATQRLSGSSDDFSTTSRVKLTHSYNDSAQNSFLLELDYFWRIFRLIQVNRKQKLVKPFLSSGP